MMMMKQTLPILAAALLAGPAFAQMKMPTLTWNFSGYFDVGYRDIKAGDPTLSKKYLGNSNVETSRLIGRLTADFGNGFQGIALEEIDQDVTNSSKANQPIPGNVFTGTPFQGQQYVGLVSPFGTVKLGIPNSWGLPATAISSPFGTGSGSGYTGITPFTRFGTTGVTGITSYEGNGSGRIIRHERTAQYESPVFAGFSGAVEFAPKNNNAADGSANNNNQWSGIGVKYQTPRLIVMAFHGQAKAGSARASGTTPPSATTQVPSTLAAGQNVKMDVIGGNFKVLPNAIVYAGWTKTKTSNDIDNSHSWNIAGKYTVNQFDFLANYLVRSANDGVNAPAANKVPKGKLVGLGADYRLDAQGLNALYWRYEKINAIDALGRSYRTNSFGLKIGFDI